MSASTGEKMNDGKIFQPLRDYLSRIPTISRAISVGFSDNGYWWVKFGIDIAHP
jgi:hypothetical protein